MSALAFSLAGITLVACWGIFFLFCPTAPTPIAFFLGNACVLVGVLLIILAISTLRARGSSPQSVEFTETSTVVNTGIYSIVRHPLYLGWLLMYPAVMILCPWWLVWALSLLGMGSMVLIVIEGEDRLLEKFGADYQIYMQEVPRFNLILGLWRKLRN
jgi:protein-S-isoprenylcysteine O-methyltransferase Ste14